MADGRILIVADSCGRHHASRTGGAPEPAARGPADARRALTDGDTHAPFAIRRLATLVTCASRWPPPGPGQAAVDWPNRPVRIVVPAAPAAYDKAIRRWRRTLGRVQAAVHHRQPARARVFQPRRRRQIGDRRLP